MDAGFDGGHEGSDGPARRRLGRQPQRREEPAAPHGARGIVGSRTGAVPRRLPLAVSAVSTDGVHRTRRRMTDGHLTKKENEVFLRRLEKRGG